MTDRDDLGDGRPEDPDVVLACEHVLRLLDPAEAAACAVREDRDAAFAALVTRWRADFAAFDADFVPVMPPAALGARIEARLFGAPPSAWSRLWNSAGLWRGVAAAAVIAAVYLGTLTPPPPATPPGEAPARLVSALASVNSEVELLAFFEPQAAVLSINRVAGDAPPGRVLELWVIQDSQPYSLGVLPDVERARVPLTSEQAARISAGATLAISSEPPGGSPDPAPSGDVLAAGPVTEI